METMTRWIVWGLVGLLVIATGGMVYHACVILRAYPGY